MPFTEGKCSYMLSFFFTGLCKLNLNLNIQKCCDTLLGLFSAEQCKLNLTTHECLLFTGETMQTEPNHTKKKKSCIDHTS
jgi:hypothetical protein